MQYSTRLAVAIHVLIGIEYFKDTTKVTSDFLAGSLNVNPVIIRKTFSQLKNAGLITVAKGTGGTALTKDPEEITMLDIYKAVEENNKVFHMHSSPNINCPVGRNIHAVLGEEFSKAQTAMENELAHISLAKMIQNTRDRIQNEPSDN